MRGIALFAIVIVLAALSAGAATFTYTNATSTTTYWSAGTLWTATPASASDTLLVFTNIVPAGAAVVSHNDVSGNFLLNKLYFTYRGPASGTAPVLHIAGNPLEFTGTGALLLLQPSGTSTPYLSVSNDLVLSSTLSVYGAANISTPHTFSGKITGNAGLTFTGVANSSQTLILLNTLNDYAGNTTVAHTGTSGGTRLLRLGESEVIPNGSGKGNLVVTCYGAGGKVARVQLYGKNETVNGLAAGIPSNANTGADNTQSVQNGAATDATLTIGDTDASASFMGALADGSTGKLNVSKTGSGTQTFAGRSTYTGTTTVSGGVLQVDFTLFSPAESSNPANYFPTGSALVLNGTTLAIRGRGNGGAITQTGVTGERYAESVTLSNANASQLVVGQALTFTQTGGSGTAATGIFITGKAAPGTTTTTLYLNKRPGVSGTPICTVSSSPTVATTSQTIKSLTLSGATASNTTIDFGTSDTVVLTIGAAPVQMNDGAKLTIANWSGVPDVGGGDERLVFTGSPTDFSSVFSQSEVFFDGFGAGYKLIPGTGNYEVVAKTASPGTVLTVL